LQPRSLVPSPIQRPKRCGTHCYIAQLINYHQRFAKTNHFWPPGAAAAAATSPAIYGARPFNMGMVPPSEAALMGNQVPGNFPGRNLTAMPDAKGAPSNLVPKFPGNHPEEKASPGNSLSTDSAQRKQQVVLQQQPQSGPMANMMVCNFVYFDGCISFIEIFNGILATLTFAFPCKISSGHFASLTSIWHLAYLVKFLSYRIVINVFCD
jgi:hypothetical protein